MVLQPTIVVERPPEGPARGKWEAAPWLIIALVVAAVAVAATYWVWRWLRSRAQEP